MDEKTRDEMYLFMLKAIRTLSEETIAYKDLEISEVLIEEVKEIRDESDRYISQLERW